MPPWVAKEKIGTLLLASEMPVPIPRSRTVCVYCQKAAVADHTHTHAHTHTHTHTHTCDQTHITRAYVHAITARRTCVCGGQTYHWAARPTLEEWFSAGEDAVYCSFQKQTSLGYVLFGERCDKISGLYPSCGLTTVPPLSEPLWALLLDA